MNGQPAAGHPSYLELDRLALGAPRSADTAAHVTGCARCRGHLDELRVVTAPSPELRERARSAAASRGVAAGILGRLPGGWGGWRPYRFAAAGGLAAAVAAAAASVVWWSGPAPSVPPDGAPAVAGGPAPVYVASKGLPSVWIYVKRGEELTLWDGRRPLEPGDRLRLKIDPQGHTHVQVFTRDGADGAPIPIFSDRLPGDAVTTLPAAWQIEGRSGRESLVVVLADRPVGAPEARRFLERGPPAGMWLRQFELRPMAPAAPEKVRPR